MGKIRKGLSDTEGLAHWTARKISNHNPMSVLDTGGKGQHFKVAMLAGDQTTCLYEMANGRKFTIKVEEVGADDKPETVPFAA